MKNNKGMTIVELIVSITLISIVLIFLMNMFIKVRGTYNNSKIQADYDMLNAIVIEAIGSDIKNYGLMSVEYESEDHDALIFTFDEYRPTKLSEPIKKILRLYSKNDRYYISYKYEKEYTETITSDERLSGITREIPEDIIINPDEYIILKKGSTGSGIIEIHVPLSTEKGNIYDINIYGVLKET